MNTFLVLRIGVIFAKVTKIQFSKTAGVRKKYKPRAKLKNGLHE